MEHKTDGGSIPHLLQDHILDAPLIKTVVVPLGEVAVCVTALEGGPGLTTQYTTTTVESVNTLYPRK